MSMSILLVPSISKGNGSGHLMRCLSLARSLGSGAAVFIPEAKSETSWSAAELSLSYSRELVGVNLVTSLRDPARYGSEQGPWDLVVLDRRSTPTEELAFWERIAPVVAIDEGGRSRESAPYVIDILPRLGSRRDTPANRNALGFLELPRNRRSPPRSLKRVLVSFGGEDPAGLSLLLARRLILEGLFEPADLTVVTGALRRGAAPVGLDGVTILGPVQDLKEHFARYDLIFTQFGLTAFEAAHAGCAVILLNPSPYHRALAKRAGFPEIGVGAPNLRALRRLLQSPHELLARCAGLVPEESQSLADFIASLHPRGPRNCPICSSPDRSVLYRDEAKSYFRCLACGTLYLMRFSPGRDSPYHEAYFFDEYRAQYGKTYIEDWPNLTALAESRLDIIEGLAQRSLGRSSPLSLLDVGCAYGPFLETARKRGQEPYGLDAAEEAASYVRRELGIPAASGDFLDPAVAAAFGGPFDVLSLWYVIEHFEDVDKALRNAAALVRPGGILAFSTPSGEGASARFDRRAFFRRSPDDHFTIWEPSRTDMILDAYGFRLERIRITGHHPERLPLLRHLTGGGKDLPMGLGMLISRLLSLGDTFEAYAVR
ncbi:MAG TPA: methyltransferase domain-containing protein, partial [Rectinemataceae bacterium]|nr:methyltransferase domain-containing protein [Rectinemataceae bacterium]